MLDFSKLKIILWGIFLPIFLFVLTVSVANAADTSTVYCYSGENKIGELSATKFDDAYWIPVKNVAQLLNMKISSFGDEVVVSNNNLTVNIVKDASVARVGNMLISLIEMPADIDGALCVGSKSLNVLFQRALGKTADLVSFRMEYGTAIDSTANVGERSREPVLYSGRGIIPEKLSEKPVDMIVVQPAAQPVASPAETLVSVGKNKPDETLAKVSEVRWNVTPQKVRVVFECIGDKEPAFKKDNDKIIISSVILPNDIKSQAEDRIQLKQEGNSVTLRGKWQRANAMLLESPTRLLIEFIFDDKPSQTKVTEPDIRDVSINKPANVPVTNDVVVLDPGHGGQDPGAVAHGVREKDINLAVALKMEKTLKSKGIKVELTRRTDVYLKLAERTAIANNLNAEVFVSIHANAMPKGKSARGFEIYLMAMPTDKDALELAKFENRELVDGKNNAEASDKRTQLLLSILGDMQQNHKIVESTNFAEVLYKAGGQSGLPMKRVAQAPFFVLRGAGMPAVLLETGFVTDANEVKLLTNSGYQQRIADAMASGIINYLRGK